MRRGRPVTARIMPATILRPLGLSMDDITDLRARGVVVDGSRVAPRVDDVDR
jgi:hypothetical protein